MLVKNWMSSDVITVDENKSMAEASSLIKEHGIRCLPVMKNGSLTGIITDRDIKRSSASDANSLDVHELLYLLSKIQASEIMTRDPKTIPIDYTIEEAASMMLENKISHLPVMDKEGRLAGIITQSDVFRVLLSVTGLRKRGILFAFQLEDKPGSIREIADILRKYGGSIASIMTSYDNVPEGSRNVYIRMYGIDRENMIDLKSELKHAAALLYIVDHMEHRREIYI